MNDLSLFKEFRYGGKEVVPAWGVNGAPRRGMYRFNPYSEFAQINHLFAPGARFWVNDDGELHRVHGPAVESDDGAKEWCLYGMKTRGARADADLLARA